MTPNIPDFEALNPSELAIVRALESKLGIHFESYDSTENQLGHINIQDGHVVYLCIEENDLKEIPSEVFALRYLKELKIGYNSIRKIPPDIGNLAHLEVLNADFNRISSLPKEVGDLRSLRSLNIEGNK